MTTETPSEPSQPAMDKQYPGDFVSFRPPSTFTPPDSESQGDSGKKLITLVCDFYVEPDGKLTMCKLGDQPMPQEKGEDEGKKEAPPSYSDEVGHVMGGLADAGYQQ